MKHEQLADPDFISDSSDEFIRSLFVLIDANANDRQKDQRVIPLITSVRRKRLGPKIIYTSSPRLRNVFKNVDEHLDKYEVHIMNPWTGFELELL